MISSTLYDLLQVSRKASCKEIKAAYLAKCLQFHPDRNQSAEAKEKFQLLSQAFQTLSDSEKRAEYDATLESLLSKRMVMFPERTGNFYAAPIVYCRSYPFNDTRKESEEQAKERLHRYQENKKALQVEFAVFAGTFLASLIFFAVEKNPKNHKGKRAEEKK